MLIIKHKDNIDVCYTINSYIFIDGDLEVYDYTINNMSGRTTFPIHFKTKHASFTISKNKFSNWLMMSMTNVNQDFKKNEWLPLEGD